MSPKAGRDTLSPRERVGVREPGSTLAMAGMGRFMGRSAFRGCICRFAVQTFAAVHMPHDQPESESPAPFVPNPFAALSSEGLPPGPPEPPEGSVPAKPKKSRGRVDILRTTAHRGGKTVTVVKGFIGIGLPEKERLAKAMQKACGVGGTVKEGRIEIQGDKRTEVAKILTDAGFRPVFAGG
jgi:translation initiation factor 1